MKKIFTIYACMAVIILNFTACENYDEDLDAKKFTLVNTWNLTTFRAYSSASDEQGTRKDIDGVNEVYTFKSDKTWSCTYTKGNQTYIASGTYTTSPDTPVLWSLTMTTTNNFDTNVIPRIISGQIQIISAKQFHITCLNPDSQNATDGYKWLLLFNRQ